MPKMASNEEQQQLQSMMAQHPEQSIGFSTFSRFADNFYWKKPSSKDEGFPKPLKEFCEENQENLTLEPLRAMTLIVAQIDALEKATVDQSEQRIGCITATEVHATMHTSIERPAASLIKSIFSPSFEQIRSPAIPGERSTGKTP
eukprot:gene14719-16250_t